MNEFTELHLCSALRSNLAKQGFVKPTPVQAQAIEPALAGRDIVATAQTGTGKTLAFALPLIQTLAARASSGGVEAVVLSPTRELAMQIHEAFRALAKGTRVEAAVVVGGVPEGRQLRDIGRGARVIVATPGRLCDFLDRGLIRLGGVTTLVLDEADRMLDMGFLPSIRLILGALPGKRQTLLFSATLERSVLRLIEASVHNPVRISIGETTQTAENVDLHVYEVEHGRKLPLLKGLLRQERGSFLVFTRTRRATDRLASDLASSGVKAARLHGERTQGQRNEALRGFKSGAYRVLVATDVAARGIHVDGIAHVVNYDLPQAPEDFIHRVGRTGRAGAPGIASTFSTRNERSEIRRIERALSLRMAPQQASGLAAAV
jgi:ATP-dependent RNA helicase RhlE